MDFERLIRTAFLPFLEEMGLTLQKFHLSGRHYRAEFSDRQYTVIVSFEPPEDYMDVILRTDADCGLEAFDDPARTPHLHHLNAKYMGAISPEKREENDSYFGSIKVQNPNDRRLLKLAKELRLVLPLHRST